MKNYTGQNKQKRKYGINFFLEILKICMKECSIHDHFDHFDGSCGDKGRNEAASGQGVDQVLQGPKVLLVYRKKGKKRKDRKESYR